MSQLRVWKIKIEDEAARIFKTGQLTKDDMEVIKQWCHTIIQGGGPKALLLRPDIWADHALHGQWSGYRSSSFGYRGRIIYRIENAVITVVVVRITPEHNYRKEN